MKITSLVRSIILSGNERPVPDRGGLKVGDRLVGRVLEVKGRERAFIDFGRFRAMADVGFPVKDGEVIHVKVVNKGTPLRLGLCAPEPAFSQKAKNALILGSFPSRRLLKELQSQIRHLSLLTDANHKGKPVPLELSNAVRNLTSFFKPLDMGRHASEISGRLKKWIEDSGIFFEKKMEKIVEQLTQGGRELSSRDLGQIPEIRDIVYKDLKPNLLILREFLAGKDPALTMLDTKDPERLRKTVEKVLGEITSRQNDTGARSMRSEPFQVFTYLIPMKELEENPKIKVYYSKKNRPKSREGFRVSLLLNLEKMGQIRTDFLMKGEHLNVDFSVSEERIKEHLDEHLDNLKMVLGDLFKSVSVKAVVCEKEISAFEFEDLVSLSTGLIDLKV